MGKPKDAIRGIKHVVKEEMVIEKQLGPYEHYTPPDVPGGLSIKIYNMDPDRTYIFRMYELAEFIKMPKGEKK